MTTHSPFHDEDPHHPPANTLWGYMMAGETPPDSTDPKECSDDHPDSPPCCRWSPPAVGVARPLRPPRLPRPRPSTHARKTTKHLAPPRPTRWQGVPAGTERAASRSPCMRCRRITTSTSTGRPVVSPRPPWPAPPPRRAWVRGSTTPGTPSCPPDGSILSPHPYS